MLRQQIQKDLTREIEDKRFIEDADKIICELFESSRLWERSSSDGKKKYQLMFSVSSDAEAMLRVLFRGMYNVTLEQKIREHEGKEEDAEELKLGGEA